MQNQSGNKRGNTIELYRTVFHRLFIHSPRHQRLRTPSLTLPEACPSSCLCALKTPWNISDSCRSQTQCWSSFPQNAKNDLPWPLQSQESMTVRCQDGGLFGIARIHDRDSVPAFLHLGQEPCRTSSLTVMQSSCSCKCRTGCTAIPQSIASARITSSSPLRILVRAQMVKLRTGLGRQVIV